MKEKNTGNVRNTYDDGDIPEVDLPQDANMPPVEPLPEANRPRKDGPGGE